MLQVCIENSVQKKGNKRELNRSEKLSSQKKRYTLVVACMCVLRRFAIGASIVSAWSVRTRRFPPRINAAVGRGGCYDTTPVPTAGLERLTPSLYLTNKYTVVGDLFLAQPS